MRVETFRPYLRRRSVFASPVFIDTFSVVRHSMGLENTTTTTASEIQREAEFNPSQKLCRVSLSPPVPPSRGSLATEPRPPSTVIKGLCQWIWIPSYDTLSLHSCFMWFSNPRRGPSETQVLKSVMCSLLLRGGKWITESFVFRENGQSELLSGPFFMD